jgi:hypothetical protein
MKKALEAALVLAALTLGAYVVRQAVARRDAVARPSGGNPALRPGPDVAKPGEPYVQNPSGAAQGLPMLKLSKPPKAAHRPAAVPPPASPAP